MTHKSPLMVGQIVIWSARSLDQNFMRISILHSTGWYMQRSLSYYYIVTMLMILHIFHHLTSLSSYKSTYCTNAIPYQFINQILFIMRQHIFIHVHIKQILINHNHRHVLFGGMRPVPSQGKSNSYNSSGTVQVSQTLTLLSLITLPLPSLVITN